MFTEKQKELIIDLINEERKAITFLLTEEELDNKDYKENRARLNELNELLTTIMTQEV